MLLYKLKIIPPTVAASTELSTSHILVLSVAGHGEIPVFLCNRKQAANLLSLMVCLF